MWFQVPACSVFRRKRNASPKLGGFSRFTDLGGVERTEAAEENPAGKLSKPTVLQVSKSVAQVPFSIATHGLSTRHQLQR